MQYVLTTSPWYGLILWIILYSSDYYLTIYCVRGFREIGHFQFEGSMELTPQFQKDVDNLNLVSKRHILSLILSSIVLLLIWWVTHLSFYMVWTYSLYLGMFLLLEVAVHLRHFRNFAMIREIRRNGGLEGTIFYRRWFSYRNSANELFITAAFFLMVAILTYSLFFFGGAIICCATAFKHARLSKKTKSFTPAAVVESKP